MAGAAPLPNIPLLAASYANLSQGMTAMSNDMAAIGNETALFANVPAVNIGNQLAQINAAIQALTNTVQALTNTVTNNNNTLQALAATVAANHQTAQANHQQLAATVANNHQAVLNTVAANHQTAQANHQTAQANHHAVVQSLAAINANLDLQPMRLANAAKASDAPLCGPTLAPLADPHPTKRDALMTFTIAQCNASATAFTQAGYILQPLPNGAQVQDRRNQLARFLGVKLGD